MTPGRARQTTFESEGETPVTRKNAKRNRASMLGGLAAGLAPAAAVADELNSGDTAWMLTATALVLFMTIPGCRSSTPAW